MDPAIPPVDPVGYVILAGTAGSRLFPLSEDLPKVLLSVANRPILWYILTALRRLGSCRVVVVTTGRFETQVKEVCCELVQRARTGSEVSDETKGECMASPSRHLQLVVDVLVVDEMLGSGVIQKGRIIGFGRAGHKQIHQYCHQVRPGTLAGP